MSSTLAIDHLPIRWRATEPFSGLLQTPGQPPGCWAPFKRLIASAVSCGWGLSQDTAWGACLALLADAYLSHCVVKGSIMTASNSVASAISINAAIMATKM